MAKSKQPRGFWMSDSLGLAVLGGMTAGKAAVVVAAGSVLTGNVIFGLGLGLGYAGHAAWKMVKR